MKTKTIAFTALFTALIYASTLIAVPNGLGGYLNLGDTMIFVCASILGVLPSVIAGAIGAALADLTLGYSMYAPFTLVVKGITALTVALLIKAVKREESKRKGLTHTLIYIAGALIMACGYFGVNLILYGGEFSLAAAQLPFDLVQGAISVTLAAVLVNVVKVDKLFLKTIDN